MAANVLPIDPYLPPPPPRIWRCGQKVKIQIFKNIVMLHIKLKVMMDAATW